MKKKDLEEKVEELAAVVSQYTGVIKAIDSRNEELSNQNNQLKQLITQYEITINLLTGRLIEGSHPLYGVGK
tara:strand:- start:17306 stop:17521 length:216 start_codon:yes stop_codon:yes gene_type:complete